MENHGQAHGMMDLDKVLCDYNEADAKLFEELYRNPNISKQFRDEVIELLDVLGSAFSYVYCIYAKPYAKILDDKRTESAENTEG